MKSDELKPIEVGYGEDKVIFHCRMITVAEEETYDQKFNDIADSDSEKYAKQYDVCRSALGEFSSAPPEKWVKAKGEKKKEALPGETPTSAIDAYFKERTAKNERIIRTAFRLFKAQLDPDVSFL